jgi:PPOX class probable F420-dependent enzyme
MASQRESIKMTPEEVNDFLAAAKNIILVTNGPDGFPDPVAMWFIRGSDGAVWMRTYGASQKVRNLERDPRCALLAEMGEHYAELRGVQLTGEIEIVRDPDRICDIVADLMVKYEGLDPAHRSSVAEAYRPRAAKQVAMRLADFNVTSWDHRKLGTTG